MYDGYCLLKQHSLQSLLARLLPLCELLYIAYHCVEENPIYTTVISTTFLWLMNFSHRNLQSSRLIQGSLLRYSAHTLCIVLVRQSP